MKINSYIVVTRRTEKAYSRYLPITLHKFTLRSRLCSRCAL